MENKSTLASKKVNLVFDKEVVSKMDQRAIENISANKRNGPDSDFTFSTIPTSFVNAIGAATN